MICRAAFWFSFGIAENFPDLLTVFAPGKLAGKEADYPVAVLK